MKERTYYICEYCTSEYIDRESAEKCEARHAKPEAIVDAAYTANDKYPFRLKVRFSNGETMLYYPQ